MNIRFHKLVKHTKLFFVLLMKNIRKMIAYLRCMLYINNR